MTDILAEPRRTAQASSPQAELSGPDRLTPGVVSGEAYRRLVHACKEGGYALPAVNVTGTNMTNAVLEAAAAARSDVIIQLSHGGAQFYAGKGLKDSFQAKVLGAVAAARHVHELAHAYGVCVILHTDHANRELVPWVEELVEQGRRHHAQEGRPLFSSHMLDLSEEPIEENLAISADMLARMAPLGMALEIELGVTGGEEDGMGSEELDEANADKLYTNPEDVALAYTKLQPLGMFSVAASFGNVHGVYAPGNVKLRPEILKASQDLVQERFATGPKPLNLVFHGGSGSAKEKIAEAVSYGVFKMNIDTDTQFAFAESVGRYVEANPVAFRHQIDPDTGKPQKKLYDPRVWLREGEKGVIARLREGMDDLGSTGRSLAITG